MIGIWCPIARCTAAFVSLTCVAQVPIWLKQWLSLSEGTHAYSCQEMKSGGGVAPSTNVATYVGSVWKLTGPMNLKVGWFALRRETTPFHDARYDNALTPGPASHLRSSSLPYSTYTGLDGKTWAASESQRLSGAYGSLAHAPCRTTSGKAPAFLMATRARTCCASVSESRKGMRMRGVPCCRRTLWVVGSFISWSLSSKRLLLTPRTRCALSAP